MCTQTWTDTAHILLCSVKMLSEGCQLVSPNTTWSQKMPKRQAATLRATGGKIPLHVRRLHTGAHTLPSLFQLTINQAWQRTPQVSSALMQPWALLLCVRLDMCECVSVQFMLCATVFEVSFKQPGSMTLNRHTSLPPSISGHSR